MTKHVLSTAAEIHVSYQIFVDRELFVKRLHTDLFVDVLKDGVASPQLNASNVSSFLHNDLSCMEFYLIV